MKKSKFSIFNVHNFWITIKFCAFNEHNHPKNLHYFVHLKCSIFKRMLKILHVQRIEFFKKCWKFYAFNKYYYSKENLHNFIRSKYAIFWSTLKILHVQRKQFFKKSLNSTHSTNTISKRIYTIFSIFKVHDFLKM